VGLKKVVGFHDKERNDEKVQTLGKFVEIGRNMAFNRW
jgi:hypothetical protein